MKQRPMLAAKIEPDKLRFPLSASPKLDGIRCRIVDGVATSRSGKPLPNAFIQKHLGRPELNGLDGELIVGPPNAEDVFFQSESGVMRRDGEPEVTFYVFDKFDAPGGHSQRLEAAAAQVTYRHPVPCIIVTHHVVNNEDERKFYTQQALNNGYEGAMFRDPNGAYKNGRSTAREGGLLKDKPKETIEVVIVEIIEAQANNNAAKKDELGFTKRSSAKAGKVGKGTAGALRVRIIDTDVIFKVTWAKGITAAMKQHIFDNPGEYLGQTAVVEFIPVGVKAETGIPRSGRFKGLRSQLDLTSDDDGD